MGYPKTLYVQHVTAEFFGRAWEERPAGYAVRYDIHDDDTQAEIARLQAEVERLKREMDPDLIALTVMEAKSLVRDSIHNAAWNDAIEAAAGLFPCGSRDGATISEAIRALRKGETK